MGFESRIEIYEPFSLDLKSNLHLENETNYEQELNFPYDVDTFEGVVTNLSTYTMPDLKYVVGNFLNIKANLTLLNLPVFFFGMRPSIGVRGNLDLHFIMF